MNTYGLDTQAAAVVSEDAALVAEVIGSQAEWPTVEALELLECWNLAPLLTALDRLPGLRKLELQWSDLTPDAFQALARASLAITHLVLNANELLDERLADAAWWPGLESIELVGEATTLSKLFSGQFSGLRTLRARVDDEAIAFARTLADNTSLRGLETLALSGQRLGQPEMACLRHLGSLTSLSIETDQPEAIGECAHLDASLRELDILDQRVRQDSVLVPGTAGDELAPVFAAQPQLSTVRVGPIGASAFEALGRHLHLVSLAAARCDLDEVSARHLAEGIEPLQSLSLTWSKIRPGAFAALAERLRGVRELQFDFTPMDTALLDELLQGLGDRPSASLSLRYCGLGDEGLLTLARWPGLAKLTSLWIDGEYGEDALAALAARDDVSSMLRDQAAQRVTVVARKPQRGGFWGWLRGKKA